MAQCLYCNKKGFFLSVSKEGLCNSCRLPVIQSMQSHFRIIDESIQIIKTTKKFETRISRFDVALDNLRSLKSEYLSKGIKGLNLDVDHYIEELEVNKVKAIEDEALLLVEKAMDKAILAKTLNAKINNANKALLILKDFQSEYWYENPNKIAEIANFIHKTEFDELILKAEKEEFKGNFKKAIDQYQEALFFLTKDDIPDSEQERVISDLESKIDKLNGQIK